MIRHVAMFTRTENASQDEIKTFASKLHTMPDAIASIRRYNHGEDLGLATAPADYVLVADFDTVGDYWSWSGHPGHVEVLERCSRPIVAPVANVQYHVTP